MLSPQDRGYPRLRAEQATNRRTWGKGRSGEPFRAWLLTGWRCCFRVRRKLAALSRYHIDSVEGEEREPPHPLFRTFPDERPRWPGCCRKTPARQDTHPTSWGRVRTRPFYAMFDATCKHQYTKAELPASPACRAWKTVRLYRGCRHAPRHFARTAESLRRTAHGSWDWSPAPMQTTWASCGIGDEYRKIIIGGRFIPGYRRLTGRRAVTLSARLKVKIDLKHSDHQGSRRTRIGRRDLWQAMGRSTAQILLTTDHSENNPQVAWTKTYGKSCLSLDAWPRPTARPMPIPPTASCSNRASAAGRQLHLHGRRIGSPKLSK